MRVIWDRATIRELLSLAQAQGEARASTRSPRDAERFRYAIYDFRKNNLGFDNLVITLDDSAVVVTLHEPQAVVIEQGATP